MCVQLESALIHLQRSVIELESFLIQELSNTANTTAKKKNLEIRELCNSIIEFFI